MPVRAGIRLGEGEGAKLLAPRQRHEVFLFLLFSAEEMYGIGAYRVMHGNDYGG